MKIYDDTNYKELCATHEETLADGVTVGVKYVNGQKRIMSRIPTVSGRRMLAAAPRFGDVFPVYPRGEWSARIKEQKAKRRRISDWQNFAPHDQNGLPTCATEDTEVLTEKGWVKWPDYNWTDLLGTMNVATGMLEFQLPTHKHVYDYKGEMIYSTNRRIDFGVTPDHRMLVRKWDERKRTLSNQYSFQKAGELGWYVGLPHAPKGFVGIEYKGLKIEDDRIYSGDDFIALLSLVISDGYAGGSENTKNWVSFCCFREDVRERVSALANKLGFHETPSRRGVWVRYNAGGLANWIRSNCYTSNQYNALTKQVPDFLKAACSRQIKLFFEWYGDQLHSKENAMYYSNCKRLIDDLQELQLRIGKRSTICTENEVAARLPSGQLVEANTRYRLVVGEVDRLCLSKKKHIEQDLYNGNVYCATVPNGTLITRRNNSILISGNCWANGPSHAFTTMRVIQGLPLVYISACSLAVPISGGHVGGDESDAGNYLLKYGGASQDTWANNDTNRSLNTSATVIESRTHHLALTMYSFNSFDEYITAALMDPPFTFAVAFNWWSHVISGGDALEIEPNSFGMMYRNNWGSWGDNNDWAQPGYVTMREGHGTPDSGFAFGPVLSSLA